MGSRLKKMDLAGNIHPAPASSWFGNPLTQPPMKSHFPRNVFILIAIGCAAFIYWDPMKPSDEVAKSAILASLGEQPSAVITEFHKGRSFTARRNSTSPLVRVWPVTANTFHDFLPRPARQFFVWKDLDGVWHAELDNLLERQWENRGYFGLGWLGL